MYVCLSLDPFSSWYSSAYKLHWVGY